jgi:hypothetical protein
MKLTQAAIAALTLPPGKTDAVFFDDIIPGFGVRLRVSGACSWIFQYRVGLGSAKAVSAATARENATRLYAQVKLGTDPQAKKAGQRLQAARTFRAVVDAYLAAKQPGLRPTSYRITKLYLTGAYFRPLHPMSISDIGHADIAARISSVTREHSSHTAAAARRAVSSLFRWAMERDGSPAIR